MLMWSAGLVYSGADLLQLKTQTFASWGSQMSRIRNHGDWKWGISHLTARVEVFPGGSEDTKIKFE